MPPRIEHYTFGAVTIDGEEYRSDVIVLPDRVISDWWRKSGHRLAAEDLEEVISSKLRVVVVGTGTSGLMAVPTETRSALDQLGIELIVEPTGRAVETYNRLASEGDVAACLHLTC